MGASSAASLGLHGRSTRRSVRSSRGGAVSVLNQLPDELRGDLRGGHVALIAADDDSALLPWPITALIYGHRHGASMFIREWIGIRLKVRRVGIRTLCRDDLRPGRQKLPAHRVD